MHTCITLIQRLKDEGAFGNSSLRHSLSKKETLALITLISSSLDNMQRFITRDYDGFQFSQVNKNYLKCEFYKKIPI